MNKVIEEKIKLLPTSPGVYVMLNSDNQVIYVGKAKVLKNRVKQYFYSGVKTEKVMAMVQNIVDFYYIITKTEIDALSLENNLIKKYKPKYNILLKDDKTYPYLKINLKKPFPRFETTRKVKNDGCKYFGPFMGGVSVKDVLEIVNHSYLLRSCSQDLPAKSVKRECLNYHIERCSAPCVLKISQKEYRELVDKAIDFLSGNDDEAEKIITEKMHRLAEMGKFELAINLRDKLSMLEKIRQKKITALNRFINVDVVAVATDGIYSSINVLITRNGRMQGAKNFQVSTLSSLTKNTLSEFLLRYYADGQEIPDEIIVGEEIEDNELIERFLHENYGKKVSVLVPKIGIRRQLYDMALSNAKDYLEKTVNKILNKEDMTTTACERLKEILNLSRYPKRMECYDISNVSGVDKVGSMVVFIDGEKDLNSYRRFTIKTVEGANDYASLQEMLERRLKKLETDEENFPKPDLIIIDGGKGQLSAVKEVFDRLNITDIDLISLAERDEEIFTLNRNESIKLPKSDYVLRMLQRIRDEAHRFAITSFHKKHQKRNLLSALDEIKGIGKVKKKALLDKFVTVENLKKASLEEIESCEGFGEVNARLVFEFFNKKED